MRSESRDGLVALFTFKLGWRVSIVVIITFITVLISLKKEILLILYTGILKII